MRFLGTLFDLIMCFLTRGLWLLWCILRYLRSNS